MKQLKLALGFALLLAGSASFADQYHYNNLVVGERAMGLGGAYCAVADDASGIIYNPSGIAFALSNDITGSANAFYQKKITYKKTIGTSDFTESSGGTLAPFFGGMQKVDSFIKGLAFAFGLYTIDSELKDQNDLITKVGILDRFHRTANIKGSTTGAGVAVAKRLGSNFSLGLSLSYIMIDELTQEYQDVQYNSGIFLSQNQRTQLKGYGLEAGIGMQAAFGTWSFGLNLRPRTLASDTLEVGVDIRSNQDGNVAGAVKTTQTNTEVKSALGQLPHEIRLGSAWFPNASFMWTFDVIYSSKTKSTKLPSLYNRRAVTNFATGTEYYITPTVPMRLGVFTNYDSRPKVVAGKTNQNDHVDYLGYTWFFGWVQPNSQVAGGVIYQSGRGQAQKLQGSTNIQNVEARSYTFAVSATHSF